MKWQKMRPDDEHALPPALSAGENDGIAGFLPSGLRRDWLLGILLVVATILAYLPAWHAGFVWDDDQYMTPPELRSLHGLVRIWTQFEATKQYYPLFHTVFWVEHKIFGGAPAGYHWLNILLHASSALLLAAVLRRLKIPGAWLAAALFALHPVEVESVAWISELKNTLSVMFYLGAALAYLGFDQTRSKGNYALALGLFLLGLMSKTAIVSLPAALLVVFWWQRGGLSWKRDALPLTPFFIAGMGAGLLTAWVERRFIGAEGSEFDFSIIERFLIAGRVVWFYLGKLLWPAHLVFIYPRWDVSRTVWWQYLFPAAVALLLGVLAWRRWRGPLAALFFFAGTLFPALGFFNVYAFRFSFVADHFQYLASLGPLTLAAAGMTALPGCFRKRNPSLELGLCAALLLTLGALTWRQCGMYASVETLWQTTLRRDPGSWMAHNNLGAFFLKRGNLDEAMAHYRATLDVRPNDTEARNNLGLILFRKERVDEAVAQYQIALQIDPDYAEAHNNLATALARKGQWDEAIAHFKSALQIDPGYTDAQSNLRIALARKSQLDEAIAQCQGALQINPDDAKGHLNLALALLGMGRTNAAAAHFQKALELGPDKPQVLRTVAWALATCPQASLRNGGKAVQLAQRANDLAGGKNPVMLRTLAAAFAEAGRFSDAMSAAQKAMELARAAEQQDLAARLNDDLKRYQAGLPLHP